MSGLKTYSGISTKIRAKQKKMFHQGTYDRLTASKSVQEVLRILNESEGYHNLFAGKDLNSLHRGAIEQILKECYYRDYISLYKFSDEKQRVFLKMYFRKLELSFLKACLRNLLNKDKEYEKLTISEDVGRLFLKYSKLDMELLIKASTIDNLIDALKGTEYYRSLKTVHEQGGNSLFEYEVSMDLYYFTRLWKMINQQFSGLDLEILIRSYGYKIDILNMQWIYRCKKYYKVTTADICAMVIPINYKLHKEELTNLIESANIEEFDRIMKSTAYGKLYPDISGDNLEEIYIYLLDKINDTDSDRYPYSIAIINTYLYKKEYEVNKITTILECIRYGIKYDKILQYSGLKGGAVRD
ncbi:MAG TPA: V-type ATPase subunit [Lachnospiraceae bacterium]|nr:V-type ATPase subunit [Lachnospiraceae bacterium]